MKHDGSQGKILRKVLSRVKKYRFYMAGSLLMALFYVVMSLLIPILVGRAIDCIVSQDHVNFAAMGRILAWVAACACAAGLSQWIMNMINNQITFSVTREFRDEAFTHIQSLPLSFLDGRPQGDLLSRVAADVDTFADGLLLGFTQLFTGVLTILGTLLFMISIHPGIALVVICITPLSLLVAKFIAEHSYHMFKLQASTKGEQTGLINETIGGAKVVRAFSHEEKSMEAFDAVNEQLGKYALKATFFSSLTNPCTRFVNSVVYAGVGLTGALMAVTGSITVGSLTVFLNYANQYTKPFNEISGVVTELQNALACAGRVFDLLETPGCAPDPEKPQVLQNVRGDLTICHMDFSYDPEKPLIEDMNVKAEKGQRIALVGPTGCGKTTFINLLMGFYDPDAGQILLDGVDTRELRREDLRKSVGMVLQNTWLRAGTIRENIAMGKADATEEEILQAAKLSHAHSFIKRLPKGYDTVIGESGGSLSEGQKQLLCIARVMLCRPPMLFLDEATSSIDTRTEIKVQKAFDTLMEGRTSFVVAHRLSTIQGSDRILCMKDGKIIEEGTHESLLAKDGFYAELYRSQFAH